SDVEHKYRAHSDLLYLTGFGEPDAYAVLAPGRPEKFVMFVRPRDPEKETWTGRRLGVEGAVAKLGADQAHPVAELSEKLKALIDYTFRRRGGVGPGYGTIVGGGANATILHYVDNQDALRKGDLLLIDAGGEYQGFTADVTRTFPVAAKFSPAQRRVYEVVLE